MNKIWTFIFRKLPVVKQLDGYKTYIGVLFLFCAYAVSFLAEVASVIPAVAPYALVVKTAFDAVAPHLATLGWIITPVGLVDKVVKA